MAITHVIDGKIIEQFKGCVLSTRERNYHDDSDFYAIVYDEEMNCVREVEYATTRCHSTGVAKVDATPEIHEKAQIAWVKQVFPEYKKWRINQLKVVKEGSVVQTVKGRKNPKGRVGKVQSMRTYKSNFNNSKYTVLILMDANGEIYTEYERNAEVVVWEREIPHDDDLKYDLYEIAEKGGYLRPNPKSGLIII